MQTDDFPRFRQVMAGMAKVYERDLDAVLLDGYWLALRDWPLADFERAAAHLIATAEHMPRPAAFTALRKPLTRVNPGDAWARVLDHCRAGAYRDGSGIDQGGAIDRAVAGLGGYQAVAMHDIDKLHFLERRFAERLEDAVETGQAAAVLGQDEPHLRLVAGRE